MLTTLVSVERSEQALDRGSRNSRADRFEGEDDGQSEVKMMDKDSEKRWRVGKKEMEMVVEKR